MWTEKVKQLSALLHVCINTTSIHFHFSLDPIKPLPQISCPPIFFPCLNVSLLMCNKTKRLTKKKKKKKFVYFLTSFIATGCINSYSVASGCIVNSCKEVKQEPRKGKLLSPLQKSRANPHSHLKLPDRGNHPLHMLEPSHRWCSAHTCLKHGKGDTLISVATLIIDIHTFSVHHRPPLYLPNTMRGEGIKGGRYSAFMFLLIQQEK